MEKKIRVLLLLVTVASIKPLVCLEMQNIDADDKIDALFTEDDHTYSMKNKPQFIFMAHESSTFPCLFHGYPCPETTSRILSFKKIRSHGNASYQILSQYKGNAMLFYNNPQSNLKPKLIKFLDDRDWNKFIDAEFEKTLCLPGQNTAYSFDDIDIPTIKTEGRTWTINLKKDQNVTIKIYDSTQHAINLCTPTLMTCIYERSTSQAQWWIYKLKELDHIKIAAFMMEKYTTLCTDCSKIICSYLVKNGEQHHPKYRQKSTS